MTTLAPRPTITAAAYDRWAGAVEADQTLELKADALLFNPSPGRDSLFEHVAHAHRIAPAAVEPMVAMCAELRRLVIRGYRIEAPILPEIRDMRRRQRGQELNPHRATDGSSLDGAVSARVARRCLRGPLGVLGDPASSSGDARVAAITTLRALVRELPLATLRAACEPAGRDALTARQVETLHRFAPQTNEGAGQGAPETTTDGMDPHGLAE